MIDSSQELEIASEFSQKVNLSTLTKRFGKDVIEHGITKNEQAFSVFDRHNHILVSENVPDRAKHNPKIEFRFRYALNEGDTLASLNLSDNIYLPLSHEENLTLTKQLVEELAIIDSENRKPENFPPKIAKLNEGLSKIKELDGWVLNLVYEEDNMDGWDSFRINLRNKDKKSFNGLFIDLAHNIAHINTIVPISVNFEKDLEETKKAINLVSDWLELPYSPKLEYDFAMKEKTDQELDDSPATLSNSFPEYFHSVLEYWKGIPNIRNLRALIGRSTDENKPILILEDPNLIGSSARINTNLIELAIRGLLDNSNGLVVTSHPDVYSSFDQSIRSRAVNSNLSAIFPSGNFNDRDWLHMFVQINEQGNATLVEDVASNNDKDNIRDLMPIIERQYGIGYEGTIDVAMAEREARKPMFMPKINTETEIIRKRYGSASASKYRQYAISALIDGNLHAQEKYQSFEKLLEFSQV
ncbi:MAG TPA: hypothetical protein PLI45_01365 [Candidatus Woesebacteria bacterium]|nr:hypothetical protein [Candidatus Woesebacteria bacterium]